MSHLSHDARMAMVDRPLVAGYIISFLSAALGTDEVSAADDY
jgi:hypothetical protein